MIIAPADPHPDSIVASIYDDPDYIDRFVATDLPRVFDSVEDVATTWFSEQPRWLRLVSTNIRSKQAVRDAIEAGDYEIGTAIGAWEIIDRSGTEIVFGEDMGFMQYRFSLTHDADDNRIEAASAVKYLWRRTGRFYFALVRPFHKRFVKLLLETTAGNDRLS